MAAPATGSGASRHPIFTLLHAVLGGCTEKLVPRRRIADFRVGQVIHGRPLAIGRPASGPGPSSVPENAGCPQAANRTERLFSANACFLGGFLPISERTRRRKNEAGKARGAQGRNRTTDTAIFSRMLYQLSYLGRSLGRKSPSSRRVIGGANGAVYRPKADCFHIPAGPTASSRSSPATTAKA
jgi:hypothetical protein